MCSGWLCDGCGCVAEFVEGLGIECAAGDFVMGVGELGGFWGVSVHRVAMWWMCECGRNWN